MKACFLLSDQVLGRPRRTRALPFLTLAMLFCVGPLVAPAHADLIANWTFENDIGAINSKASGTTSASLLPATGSGSAFGVHANSSTQWTAIVGNGSSTAFNSNFWSVGDYYQFNFSSTNLTGLQLTFDQTSSFTGPSQFQVATTSDGTNWTNLGSVYTVQPNGVGNPGWASSGGRQGGLFTFALTLPDGTTGVRLVDSSTVSGSGTVSTTGADRVDNVMITGSPLSAVPEPATMVLSLQGGSVLMAWAVWRRRSGPKSRSDA